MCILVCDNVLIKKCLYIGKKKNIYEWVEKTRLLRFNRQKKYVCLGVFWVLNTCVQCISLNLLLNAHSRSNKLGITSTLLMFPHTIRLYFSPTIYTIIYLYIYIYLYIFIYIFINMKSNKKLRFFNECVCVCWAFCFFVIYRGKNER